MKQVFLQVADCDEGACAPLLAAACGDDGDLRAEVEALLAEDRALARADEAIRTRRTSRLLGFVGSERFTLEAELGSGGFGVVFRAFDRKLGQWVALKALHNPHAESAMRFKREFRAIGQLHLPNLVRCLDLFSEERQLFFTMELVDGVPILEHLRRSPPTGTARLSALFAQLAQGVSDLHAAGWLHRDLKPSNVLIDRTDRVVILDLGLARALNDLRHSSQLFGSPYYMAPELFTQALPTEASDWYSVGVMLYEALTGRPPWSATWPKLMLEKLEAEVPRVRTLVPEAPQHLDELCAALLCREPERRPRAPEVLRRLGRDALPVSPSAGFCSQTAVAPFVGRNEHLSTLEESYRRCSEGRPSVVEVTGTSGIGKTALVQHFLDRLRQEDDSVVILEGRCYEHESIGYKVFDGVVDALSSYLKHLPSTRTQALLPRNLRELLQVFPALSQAAVAPRARPRVPDAPADGIEVRRKAFDALKEMLGRIAEQHPLVIFVDDVQWGDRDSINPLQRLLSSEDAPPLLLIATYRTELSDTPVLADLREALVGAEVSHRRLAVEALAPQEARQFAVLLLGEEHPAISSIVDEAQGVPYFLAELVGRSQVEWVEGRPDRQQRPRLDHLLLERVEQLPADARRLLEVLSIARMPLPIETARAAASSPDSDALKILYGKRLARPFGTGSFIEPHHDRIREVVETAIAPGSRPDLHRRLALALEARDGDAEQMAVHFRAAGDVERSLHFAVRAAREAMTQAAFNRAARLYEMALDLAGGPSHKTADLLEKLGDAQANAGLGRKAADSYLAAAELSSTDGKDLRRRAAEQLLRIGEVDGGLSVMSRIVGSLRWPRVHGSLAMLGWIVVRAGRLRLRGLGFRPRSEPEIPREALLRSDLAWTAFLGFYFANPIRAVYIHSYQILDALKTGEPRRVVRALAAEAALAAMLGTSRRYHRLMAELNRVSDSIAGPAEHPWPCFAKTIAAFFLGRWAECRQEAELAEQSFAVKGAGVSWELAIVRALGFAASMLAGDMRESQRRLDAQLRDSHERGDLFARGSFVLLGSSHVIRIAQDQPELGELEVQDLRRHWPAARLPLLDYNAGFALAEMALYQGKLDEAWAFFTQKASPYRRALLRGAPILRIFYRYLRARVAIALGRRSRDRHDGLLRVAASDARALLAEKQIRARGMAHLVLAGLASVRGDMVATVEALRSAEHHLEAEGVRPHVMVARLVRGRLIAGEEGQALVSEAEAWAKAQGVRKPYQVSDVFAPGIL